MAWRSWPIWSTTSSMDMAADMRSRSSRTVRKVSMTSTWLTVSRSPRPCQPSSATWLRGSSREPNFDVVRRTPLATARTLPCCSVISVTIRSASPSRMVRSTTPRSRKRVIAAGGLPGRRRRRRRRAGPGSVGRRPRGARRGRRRAGRAGRRAGRAAAAPEQVVGGDEGGEHRRDHHERGDRGEPGHVHEHDEAVDEHAEHDAGRRSTPRRRRRAAGSVPRAAGHQVTPP